MASDLADHLDSKLAEALQIGATAIEAIETLEERMNQEGAAVQNSMVSGGAGHRLSAARPLHFPCRSAVVGAACCCDLLSVIHDTAKGRRLCVWCRRRPSRRRPTPRSPTWPRHWRPGLSSWTIR